LAAKSAYGLVCMPNAKGFFPENNPQFIDFYWGSASLSGRRVVVESSDAYLRIKEVPQATALSE